MTLRAGDWVEVRSKEEILSTLDKAGCLDKLPFMPQMFQYCGQRFRVYKRAHKTCDTINYRGGRGLTGSGTVHLDLRCDGKAHGGCQAACLLFWKEAWLIPCDEKQRSARALSRNGSWASAEGKSTSEQCSEDDVWKATHAESDAEGETRYICQATQVLEFTTPIPRGQLGQYVEDYFSGNTNIRRMLRAFMYAHLLRFNARFPAFRKAHDRVQALFGGDPFPRLCGTIPEGKPTPISTLNLQPGEFVRVKSFSEIRDTIDTKNSNRGMLFDAELVPYCGGTYRVRTRVENFIDERTGKMRRMKTPAVILENVWCQSCYSNDRYFCPRSIYSWWREIWLERLPAPNSARLDD
jgi:hypothetical protein